MMRNDRDQTVGLGDHGTEFRSAVEQELDRLGSLEPNWDAQGAQPIDPGLIAAARQLVSHLPSDVSRRPCVVPMAAGNLQFEWHEGPRSLELEIEDPETIHYLKWHPEKGIEDEGFCSLQDVEQIGSLIRWFNRGGTNE